MLGYLDAERQNFVTPELRQGGFKNEVQFVDWPESGFL